MIDVAFIFPWLGRTYCRETATSAISEGLRRDPKYLDPLRLEVEVIWEGDKPSHDFKFLWEQEWVPYAPPALQGISIIESRLEYLGHEGRWGKNISVTIPLEIAYSPILVHMVMGAVRAIIRGDPIIPAPPPNQREIVRPQGNLETISHWLWTKVDTSALSKTWNAGFSNFPHHVLALYHAITKEGFKWEVWAEAFGLPPAEGLDDVGVIFDLKASPSRMDVQLQLRGHPSALIAFGPERAGGNIIEDVPRLLERYAGTHQVVLGMNLVREEIIIVLDAALKLGMPVRWAGQ